MRRKRRRTHTHHYVIYYIRTSSRIYHHPIGFINFYFRFARHGFSRYIADVKLIHIGIEKFTPERFRRADDYGTTRFFLSESVAAVYKTFKVKTFAAEADGNFRRKIIIRFSDVYFSDDRVYRVIKNDRAKHAETHRKSAVAEARKDIVFRPQKERATTAPPKRKVYKINRQ